MTTSAGSRLSDAMLKRVDIVVEHLRYEFAMLQYCFDCLETPSTDSNYNNVMIESFCLHARNLIDFFWGTEPPSGDTPSAIHFTVKEYVSHRGDDPRRRGIYSKLNKQVAQLSYSRTTDMAKKIGPEERAVLKELIQPEFAKFYEHLRDPYRQVLNGERAPPATD